MNILPNHPQPVWLIALLLGMFGCDEIPAPGSGDSPGAGGSFEGEVARDSDDAFSPALDPIALSEESPPPRRDLDAPTCDADPIAEVRADGSIGSVSELHRYALRVDDGLHLTLLNEDGESLGQFSLELDLPLDERTARAGMWTLRQSVVTTDGERASQDFHGRALGDGRLWWELVHRSGDEALHQWVTVDADFQPSSSTLVRVVDGPGEGITRLPDGRYARLLEVGVAEGRLPQEEVDAWLESALPPTFFTSPAHRLLQATGSDPGLLSALDAHLRRCTLAEREEREASLIRPMARVSCAMEDGQQQKSRCSEAESLVRDLQTLLTINDVMGAVGTGVAITAALVATGTIVAGPAIAVTFVGVTFGTLVVSQAVDRFVQNNRGSIVDGAGRAGSLVTGDSQDGRAFGSFFGGSHGDPHFDTFDGLSYDFQGAGEFILVRGTSSPPFEVQTRQSPLAGLCPHVSVNSSVAMLVGERVLQIQAIDSAEGFLIDGEPVTLTREVTPLSDGVTVVHELESNRWILRWSTGERVRITRRAFASTPLLDVEVGLPPQRAGAVEGLLGSFDGDRSTDLRTQDGTLLQSPIPWNRLTREFGASWRVSPEGSLFVYGEGTDWWTVNDVSFPEVRTRLEDLPAERLEMAITVCEDRGLMSEAAFNSCVLDVGCTGEPGLADSHVDRPETTPVEVLPPLERTLAEGTLPRADNRVLFTFEGLTPAVDDAPPYVQVSDIVDGPGISIFEVTNVYNYPNRPVLRFSPVRALEDVDEAVDADAYVEFTITPLEGAPIIERFHVSMARGANIGPERGLGLRTSQDGFERTLWSDTVLTQRPQIERFSIPIGGAAVDGPTVFRLYVHTSGSARTLEVGDIGVDLRP